MVVLDADRTGPVLEILAGARAELLGLGITGGNLAGEQHYTYEDMARTGDGDGAGLLVVQGHVVIDGGAVYFLVAPKETRLLVEHLSRHDQPGTTHEQAGIRLALDFRQLIDVPD